MLYFVDNGCKRRSLPHDFPPYTTVANFYYAAIRSGLWEKLRLSRRGTRKITGRKRHIVMDIMDNLLTVIVHAANIHDTTSGILAAGMLSRTIHPFNASMLMEDTVKLLSRMFSANRALALIFQFGLSPSGRSCPNAGSLNALWLGSTTPAIFPEIMKYLSGLLRRFV